MSPTEIYYVLRLDTQRVVGRVYAVDEPAALELAEAAHPVVAEQFGVRVELASKPPTRLASQLMAMSRANRRPQHGQRRSS